MTLAIVAAALWLGCVAPAAAYCVAHGCDPDAPGGERCLRDAKTGCPLEGAALFRPDGCIRFAVQQGAAERTLELSDGQFEALVRAAFDTWASVDCGDGKQPSIAVHSFGVVHADAPFACDQPGAPNLDVWTIARDLSQRQVVTSTSAATAGVTHARFVEGTGEIYDADVSLNGLWLLVQDTDDVEELLRIVVLHEAGHALGLAHSRDREALMYSDYRLTPDRTLTQDDIDGVCALFPPGSVSCQWWDEPPSSALDRSACAARRAPVALADAYRSDDAGVDVPLDPALWGGDCARACRVARPGADHAGVGMPLLLWALASAARGARRRNRLD